MNKEKYIIELRKRLSLLNEDEVDRIILEYQDYIKQKLNEGVTEGLALEHLGNVNDLAKKILESYKISETYIRLFIGKEKVIDEINDFAVKFAEKSSDLYNKFEESFTEFARTTGHVAKEKLNDVRKILRKKSSDDNEDENKDEGTQIHID